MTMIAITLACFVSSTAGGTVHEVAVGPGGGFVFAPADVIIEVGDTVHWTWDSDGHNVGSGLPGNPNDAFLSGPPAPTGTEFEVVFDQAFLDANPMKGNVYDYHCHPHGGFGMIGSIEVEIPCPWDCAEPNDGVVGTADLLALLSQWGEAGTTCDPDGDGVGTADLLALLSEWGACP
jgi:plastocyanin